MEISVDGNRRDVASMPATMGDLISDLKCELLDSGRVVLSLAVDGRAVDARYENEIAGRPVSDFQGITLSTADPKTLCLATLEEVANHIQPIIDESARISELIDQGRHSQAMGRIMPCLEVWGAVITAIHNIAQLMQVNLDEVSTGEESLTDSIRALVSVMQSIKAAMDSRDLVSIRDALKHEMPETAHRIAAQLDALSNMVAAK